jgi:hypothetical protein
MSISPDADGTLGGLAEAMTPGMKAARSLISG